MDSSGRRISQYVFETKTPEYDGKQKGHPVEGWHMCMGKIFDELNIPDNGLKAKLAAITLTENAARWWRFVKKVLLGEKDDVVPVH